MTSPRIEHLAEGVTLYLGDCLERLAEIEANSIDACVTDPPYHLTANKKGGSGEASFNEKSPAGRSRISTGGGFMGKEWDGGDVAFRVELWREVFRVLKPGAHILAFGGTRTCHRMACAIEDAGFEIRDQIQWLYGSGFPKSLDVSKALLRTNKSCPKIVSAAQNWSGFGTALKPACEPIVLARKPLSESTVAANFLKWGTGALNIDGCRVATDENLNGGAYTGSQRHDGDEAWRFKNGGARQPMPGDDRSGAALGMFQEGKTVGADFKQPPGRWPANVIHDGSEEVFEAFPDAPGQQFYVGPEHGDRLSRGIYGDFGPRPENPPRGDGGSAARFFYTAKADADDRLGSKHPTVKPLDLMQYLVRLVTPPKGLVLDPFAGTGTTGEACIREKMRAILIEREAEYQDDIRRRMKLAMAGPETRARESIKAKTKDKPVDHGPLFGGGDTPPPRGSGRRIYGVFADEGCRPRE